MSAGSALLDIERRLDALERDPGTDQLQTNPLVVQPDGSVLSFANFVRINTLVFNVKDYGAKGDDVTDDTAAINAARDAARGAGVTGAIIYFPLGTYLTTGLLLDSVKGYVLLGASRWGSIIKVLDGGIGINIYSAGGTGGVTGVLLSNLQVNYVAGPAGTTGVQVWNATNFTIENCVIYATKLALSIQGAFVGAVRDSEVYLQNPIAGAIAALWVGSGKSAPYTGAVTLSGCGDLHFDATIIEAFGVAAAVLLDENTYTIKFDTCQFAAEGGAWHGMIQADGNTLQLTVENCYQEAAHNDTGSGVDIAIGTNIGTCGAVTLRNYNSTGSSGQDFAIDVAWCQRLRIDTINCIAYTSGVINFQGLPAGTDDRHYIAENVNDGGAGGTIYNSTDLSIDVSYRGDIHRTNRWQTIHTRPLLLDSTNVTGPGTWLAYPFAAAPPANGTPDPQGALAFFEIDPADHEYSRWRVRMLVQSNNVAPNRNINGGLVPSVGTPAGGSGAVTRGNGAFITDTPAANPPANTEEELISPQAELTTPGSYALAASVSNNFTANSACAVTLELQRLT